MGIHIFSKVVLEFFSLILIENSFLYLIPLCWKYMLNLPTSLLNILWSICCGKSFSSRTGSCFVMFVLMFTLCEEFVQDVSHELAFPIMSFSFVYNLRFPL